MKAELQQLATDAQADKVMTLNMVIGHQAQLRWYELLAEAFNLQG